MAVIIGIAALLLPVMRPHGEGVALWYFGFRIIEAGAFVVGTVSVLSLISVSEASIAATAPSAPVYEGLRSLALGGNWWAGKMATVAFIFGAIGLYALLYRSRLVPRFIAAWGLVSVALLIVANLLAVDVTAGFQPLALLYADRFERVVPGDQADREGFRRTRHRSTDPAITARHLRRGREVTSPAAVPIACFDDV